MNLEVIDLISSYSQYIEYDSMVIYYCLFFCVFYKNPELVEFFRGLIQRIPQNPKIDRLLELIDTHGIDRLRTSGEPIN